MAAAKALQDTMSSYGATGDEAKSSAETIEEDVEFAAEKALAQADEKGSPSAISLLLEYIIYGVAIALLVIVFLIPSPLMDPEGRGHHAEQQGKEMMMMRNIAYGTLAAGFMGYLMYLLKQPLILGYMLGGVLVGPIGLQLIIDESEIATMSELGLIFLLFMIGLELNIEELAHLGSKVFVSGFVQFPVCVAVHLSIFTMFSFYGIHIGVGEGNMSEMYVAVCCGLSSTMVVVKKLQDKGETQTQAGKISIGVLIFQDMWAIVVLAIQPNIDDPQISGILKTFAVMMALVVVSFFYAKHVMPRLLASASHLTEMRLILSLAWCFFVCAAAILPFIHLSMELAALIAGASLATFPYSHELNAKIRYIRDFFITLYFVSLGMQIPIPTGAVVLSAVAVSTVVLLGRWVGVFLPIYLMGGGGQPATITTLNLSQVSEFALVICAIGHHKGHIHKDTLTILVWTFLILAVGASYLMDFNNEIYNFLYSCIAQEGWKETVKEPEGRHEFRSAKSQGRS